LREGGDVPVQIVRRRENSKFKNAQKGGKATLIVLAAGYLATKLLTLLMGVLPPELAEPIAENLEPVKDWVAYALVFILYAAQDFIRQWKLKKGS
jgi:hypothetical protein